MKKTKHLIALIILDGWGHSELHYGNAIKAARPKTFTTLWKHYPHALLQASGRAVGLPAGYMGNSEVGHLTIGAGRVIQQPLTRINEQIQDGSFFDNNVLKVFFNNLEKSGNSLHLLGLLSDAGVHSHEKHLYALIKFASKYTIKIFVHAFFDGRDVAPHSAQKYRHRLERVLRRYPACKLGSVSGRFYAMDRDHNTERTRLVYDMLIGAGKKTLVSVGESEEFLAPTLLLPEATIKPHDGIIFFNFRPDRMRQLTQLFSHHPIVTMASYGQQFNNPVIIEETLGASGLLDVIAEKNMTIFSCAETEKYAHITYFFNGGRETERGCETRVLIPSHKVTTYAQDPCMSAPEITQAVVDSLNQKPADFYLVNYANADMVGHSGNFESTVAAITCLDRQLKILYEEFVINRGGTLYVTADHGNAEEMCDLKNKTAKTSHTTNPVPFIMVRGDLYDIKQNLPLAQLADIAPFILKNFD